MWKFEDAIPVLQVADVERSVNWYRELFGFDANTFPQKPPFSYAIMTRDKSEFSLQCADADGGVAKKPSSPKYTGWAIYFRLEGGDLLKLLEIVQVKWPIVRGPERMFYNMVEFEIDDPDGHRLVFGEELGPEVEVPICPG